MDGRMDGQTDGWGRTDTGSVPTCGRNARIRAEVDGENHLRECPHQYGLSPEIIFAADAYYSRSQKVVSDAGICYNRNHETIFADDAYYSRSQKVVSGIGIRYARSPKAFLLPSYIISRVRKYFGAGICYNRSHETIFGAVVHYFGT